LRWDVSTYSSGDRIYQRIEDVITTSGQSVTLSYWAKAETATTMVPQATQAFGSGGSTAVTTAIDSVALTTSWQKFTRTFTLPSVSGKTIGAGSFLEVGLLRFTTSYTGYVDIANVQLELGSVATDFEHRSYGEELALCQRYYQQYGTGIANTALVNGANWAGNNMYGVIQWKQPMRATPTVTFSSQTAWIVLTAGLSGATTYIATNTVNQYSAELNITANISITAGYSGWIRHQASSYMYVSAEL
jgi:hypothetical protein